ncbi:succinic semialdehyde dehydrogenase [Mycolicibacterium litorale]|uniref:succinic semialdehyde dehydrogenase n=1 Tax=Mycolicibacterium litorale TaxID=758802 RepID=UPI0034926746
MPLLGDALPVLMQHLEWSRAQRKRYGPIWWGSALGHKIVFVVGPESIAEVLTNRDKVFSNKLGWGAFIEPFFSNGVMLKDFDEHLHHRRMLQQAFTRSRLESYLGPLNRVIDRNMAGWPSTGRSPFFSLAKQVTLDVANEVFAGVTLGPETEAVDRAFVAAVTGTKALVRADVPGGAYARGLRGRKLLEEFFRSRIPQRRNAEGEDLLSVLCRAVGDEGEMMSDDEIIDHMIFVMMAAHETSTITMAMMAYFLGKYPHWQERAREESLELDKPFIDFDDLEQLPSLDLVMKESLRMFAPVGMQVRAALRDTEIDGHYVPAGTIVGLCIFASHRMGPWWSNPDTFDPERFSEQRHEHKNHRNNWAPFGSGVHKCLGMSFGVMEIKALMHQMLLNYTWTVPAGYEVPIDYATGPTPADGLPIELRAREGAQGHHGLSLQSLERLRLQVHHSPGSETVDATAPFDLKTYVQLPVSTRDDVAHAVLQSRSSQREWAERPVAERSAVLLRFHDMLLEHQDEIIDILQLETGKARFTAFGEMLSVVNVARHYGERAAHYLKDTHPRGLLPGLTSMTEVRVPRGVVGVVGPWNYPLFLSIGDAVPALTAGNGVVIKADSQTALTVLWAVELLERSGFPRGLVQVVVGPGSVVGAALIDAVDYVCFTGSTRAGRIVGAQAGGRLIGCSLELGGKNPMIVCHDADVDAAVEGAIKACFTNSGQLCLSIERIYVDRGIFDRFVAQLVEHTRRLRLGQSYGYDIDMGPLTSAEQLKTVIAQVEDAVTKGAQVRFGGRTRGDLGPLFYEPTVLTDVPREAVLYAEETFGPVVSVYPFDTEDDAIVAANSGIYGLSASVWTRDIERGQRLARRIIAGAVNVNDGYAAAIGSVEAQMGGTRDSGLGRRQGAEGILKYTEAQTIATQRLIPMPPISGLSLPANVNLLHSGVRLMRRLGLR